MPAEGMQMAYGSNVPPIGASEGWLICLATLKIHNDSWTAEGIQNGTRLNVPPIGGWESWLIHTVTHGSHTQSHMSAK